MFKFLIILILIGYSFYRITSFLFSGLFRGFVKNQEYGGRQSRSKTSKKAPNSNVNIDSVPNKNGGKTSDYGGGDYVDYEEV